MRRQAALAAVLLAGCLTACSSAAENDSGEDSTEHSPTNETKPGSEENSHGSGAEDGISTGTGTVEQKPSDSSDSGTQSNGETDGAADSAPDSQSSENGTASGQDSSSTDADQAQKQMALDTLTGLVEDAKKGKVYRLTDSFYVGKTTQTDVHNEIGKPERQDTFDRYTGSMGQASYDLRYDKNGVLAEARYLGTNVERQTNLGGITSADIVKQLGQPATKRPLPETKQTSYIFDIGNFQLQFVMSEKDTADHVNLLVR